jgi:ABC-type multidrug transport system fused ATPase/permease subunit
MAAQGKPPGAEEATLSLSRIRFILKSGFKLVRLCPAYVAAYVLLNLVGQTAIPLILPVVLGQLTNSVLSVAPPPDASHQAPASQSAAPQTSAAPPGPAGQSNSQAPPPPQLAKRTSSVKPYTIWLALTLLLFPLGIWFRIAQTKMDGMMEKQVRQSLYEKVIRQAPEFFHRHNPGELGNILTQTSIEAQQALRSLTVDPFLSLVSLSIAMTLIAQQLKQINGNYLWPTIAVMVLVGAGSAWLTQRKSDKAVGQSQREAQEQRFAISGLADAAIKSPEEIQAMDAEEFFSKRHEKALARLMNLKVNQTRTMEVLNAAIGLPTQVILACLYGLIVYQTLASTSGIAPGVFITIAGLTPQLMQPFKSFAVLGVVASSSWPAIERVSEMLAQENRIKDLPGARDITGVEPTLEARHVQFGYVPGRPKVFDDLNFRIPRAGITGLVARMGQGKTTFFRLALRFYDPEAGQVLFGGHPTSAFTLRSLRTCAVIMSQFPAFFYDTVGENFRVARPDATDAEIRALCEKTRLWPILEKTIGADPLTKPFAGALELSGGQKKLFALTRCLLRNPTFLFLDEPTTNMSNDEKYLLIPLMREACAGKTVVVVDHDLSWLTQFCDNFVVLDAGKIVQQGTAAELLSAPGVLNELYSLAHPA